MDISKALRLTRIKLDIPQGEAAEKVGLTQSYLSLVEKGVKTPSMDVVEKLCKLYNMPLGIIFWHSITEKDVPLPKRGIYKSLKPTIDDMINRIF